MSLETLPKTEPQSEQPRNAESVNSRAQSVWRSRSTLSPVAYNESVMPSLRLVRSSRLARRVGRVLLVLLFLVIVLMAFAPWQQSIRGEGKVLAYSPQARQQVIEASIKGRIVSWGEGIYENARVSKGQKIVEIQDLDAGLLSRLQEQLGALQQSLTAMRQVKAAAENSLEAAQVAVASYQAQLEAYREVKTQIVAAADSYIEQAQEKLNAEMRSKEELEAALEQVEEDYYRQEKLFKDNIVSELKFQMAERKYKEAQKKVEKAEAYIQAARNELEAKKQEREAKSQKAQVDIDDASAKLQKARGDVAKAESEVAKADSELNKAIKDKSEMETKLSRQQTQVVTAPLDGYLLGLIANQGGALIKEGDLICTIVPDTEDRAVEMWISGNDIPLVQPGDHVRLQFEGWPAVQFSGWPSVAVGTFGGEVISVNRTDNGRGQFACLVLPDESEQEWPEERFLRQGVRANGWVLLNQVPLWWEVWRKMNGFPLIVDSKQPGGKDTKTSSPAKIAKPK